MKLEIVAWFFFDYVLFEIKSERAKIITLFPIFLFILKTLLVL